MYEVYWTYEFMNNYVSGKGRFRELNIAKEYVKKVRDLFEMENEFEIYITKVTREHINV